MSEKKIDRSLPTPPKIYRPDTGGSEALPGMGTYVGCPTCERAVVPEWGWCPFCGQRLQW